MKSLVCTIVLLSAILSAQRSACAQYLKPDSVDFKAILAPPPAADSEQSKNEIEQMIALQKGHTLSDPDVVRARGETRITPFVFSDVLGSWFNPDDLPVTAKLLTDITKETKKISDAAKDSFGRKRPFLVDARVKLLVPEEDTPSYPSSHATRGRLWSLILAKMLPDEKEALVARGRQIGDDRVLGGVHFPSDVEAGRKLAEQIFQNLSDNPDFAAQLEKAAQECQAHRKPT